MRPSAPALPAPLECRSATRLHVPDSMLAGWLSRGQALKVLQDCHAGQEVYCPSGVPHQWSRVLIEGVDPSADHDWLNRPLGEPASWPASMLMRRRKAVDVVRGGVVVRLAGDTLVLPVQRLDARQLGDLAHGYPLETPGRMRLVSTSGACTAEVWQLGFVGPRGDDGAMVYCVGEHDQWQLADVRKEPAR